MSGTNDFISVHRLAMSGLTRIVERARREFFERALERVNARGRKLRRESELDSYLKPVPVAVDENRTRSRLGERRSHRRRDFENDSRLAGSGKRMRDAQESRARLGLPALFAIFRAFSPRPRTRSMAAEANRRKSYKHHGVSAEYEASKFVFDAETNTYVCPQGKHLRYDAKYESSRIRGRRNRCRARHLRDVVATNVASIYNDLLGRALHALLNPLYGRRQLLIIAASLRGIRCRQSGRARHPLIPGRCS